MMYIDVSEKKRVKDRFFKRLGKNVGIKELGVFDCDLRKILLTKMSKFFCATETETPLLIDNGFTVSRIKTKCINCDYRCYVKFADIEIAPERAWWERKTAADFVASRKDRLYDQLNRMDMFIEGRKGLILEGMPRHSKFQDSKDFFSGYDKRVHDLRGLSPLETYNKYNFQTNEPNAHWSIYYKREQAIEIAGGDKERNWCLSFIRECKMRDIEFVQTWDLDETITFLEIDRVMLIGKLRHYRDIGSNPILFFMSMVDTACGVIGDNKNQLGLINQSNVMKDMTRRPNYELFPRDIQTFRLNKIS